MNREVLKKRLDHLKEQQANLLANINAYNGAIEECSFWLNQFPQDEIKILGVEDVIPNPQ